MDDLIAKLDVEGLQQILSHAKEKGEDDELQQVILDRKVRDRGMTVARGPGDVIEDNVRKHLGFVLTLCKIGVCSKSTAVQTMQDMFEVSGIGRCERLFGIVEENMAQFKQPPLSEACQHYILRMCNDLLKRLSRSAETSFCGRILFFLSRFLPLSEKSGLNLMGHFNTQNTTKFETAETQSTDLISTTDEDIETGEIKEAKDVNIPVDHALYSMFWQMQTFFSNPTICYDKLQWTIFHKNINEILNVFASYKLEKSGDEDDGKTKGKRRMGSQSVDELMDDADSYFAKYLTSPKLLQLQLNDSQFRRYFLLQCLILFQYLTTPNKFKQRSQVLSDDQMKLVSDSQDKCFRLLRETHPKGSHFAESVKCILLRENEWSRWKSDGCPDMTQLADKQSMQPYRKRPRVTFDLSAIDLGSSELTKLWNIEPDMLTACRNPKRKFAPSLVEFIRDPLDEMDPEQQVEDKYKSVRDPSFQWRACRLLLAESSQYIVTQKEQTVNITQFLEHVILNTGKNMEEFKSELLEREERESLKRRVEESLRVKITNNEGSSSPGPDIELTDEGIMELSKILSRQWKKLSEVMQIECGKNDNEDTYVRLLNSWITTNCRSMRKIRNLLLDADLLTDDIISILKSMHNTCAVKSATK